MKVYVVSHGDYSSYSVDAVFTNKEMAEKFCAVHNKYGGWADYDYEEWETDECDIQTINAEHNIGYEYNFDTKGDLKFPNYNPHLIIGDDEKVHASSYGYHTFVIADGRSEEQCRKIACDRMALYKANDVLF